MYLKKQACLKLSKAERMLGREGDREGRQEEYTSWRGQEKITGEGAREEGKEGK